MAKEKSGNADQVAKGKVEKKCGGIKKLGAQHTYLQNKIVIGPIP